MPSAPHPFGNRRLALLAALTLFECTPAAVPPPEPVPRKSTPTNPTSTRASTATIATRREETTETMFGVTVSDPYRWLEDANSLEVQTWVAAQNGLTRRNLDALGVLPSLQKRLKELLAIGSVGLPAVRRTTTGGLRFFYRKREGAQNQPVLLWRDGNQGAPKALVDVNELASDGTVALDYFDPSPDGSLVAFGLSRNGSEDSTLYVRDVALGRDRPDVISRTRYASVCWHADGKGFFYTRFPAPGSVPAGEEQYHRQLYEHRLGADPDADPLVFGSGREMTDYPDCTISPNGRWLVVSVHVSWNRTDVFLADTQKRPLSFTELTERKEQTYAVVARDNALWISTNDNAPRYALYRASPRNPKRQAWTQVLPEHPRDVLDQFDVFGDKILASYSYSAVSRLERFDQRGRSLGDVAIDTLGGIDGISGVHDEARAFYALESFLAPATIYQVDLKQREPSTFLEVSSSIKPSDYRVEQRFASSKDGTRVPYTLIYKSALSLTSGDNPTLLYGYGGFNISLTPGFLRTTYAFLERGGVYVQANLRGGGEFGEAWHRAGQLDKKQNVFDDFFAVSEALIHDKVTRKERLAIYGRSNGGLLVAAALTQRPELFRAAVSAVPLTDMLRYPRFLMARLWTPEYGDPQDPKAFEWLYAYSPYHRVQPGVSYPAALFLTADSDTRVDPAHARKMVAELQAANASDHPILLRTDGKAGHGAGKPMQKVAEEHADLLAFLLWQLGMLQAPSN